MASPKVTSLKPANPELDEILSKKTVRVKNVKRVEEKLGEMIGGKSEKLMVIADFDMTMSRYHLNGQRCNSTHSTLVSSRMMPKNCKEILHEDFDKYYPMEVDPTIPFQDKLPMMTEWWERTHSILVDCGLKQDGIAAVLRNSKTVLRDGCADFLETLSKDDVPIIVFSAGLGDLIMEAIRQQATLHSNIKFISNFMEFDFDGVISGFKGETIHILNKNLISRKNDGSLHGLQSRPNVILLGDSPGDVTMCDGLQSAQNILKIGFLNDKIDAMMKEYMEMYDIVLVDDQTFDVPNAILSMILK